MKHTYDIDFYKPYTFITVWECDPRYTFPQDKYTVGQLFTITPPVIPQQDKTKRLAKSLRK